MIGNKFYLDKDESNHASRILRLKEKDEICLLDGVGVGYHAVINSIDNKVSGTIIKTYQGLGENDYTITLAPALIKRDRFELLLEKATELGVTDIQPLSLERSVKKTLNLERCQKIITSSAKQCRRSQFPILYKPLNMKSLLKKTNGLFISAVMGAKEPLSTLELFNNITIIIGPEGDFTKNEIEQMKNANVLFYHLGERRLRAETAALNSLSILNELLI